MLLMGWRLGMGVPEGEGESIDTAVHNNVAMSYHSVSRSLPRNKRELPGGLFVWFAKVGPMDWGRLRPSIGNQYLMETAACVAASATAPSGLPATCHWTTQASLSVI